MIEYESMYVGGNATTVGFEIERRINEGWEIDPNHPLSVGMFGAVDCWLCRDPANAKDAPPKPSRGEILKRAREAKAAKKAADEQNKEEPAE